MNNNKESSENIFLVIMMILSVVFLVIISSFLTIIYEKGLPTKEKENDQNQRLHIEPDDLSRQNIAGLETSKSFTI